MGCVKAKNGEGQARGFVLRKNRAESEVLSTWRYALTIGPPFATVNSLWADFRRTICCSTLEPCRPRFLEDRRALAGGRWLPAARGDGLLRGIFAVPVVSGADRHFGVRIAGIATGCRRTGGHAPPGGRPAYDALAARPACDAAEGRAVPRGVRRAVRHNGMLFASVVVFLHLDYMFDRIFGVPKSDKKPTIWRYVRTVLFDRLYAFLMLMIVLLLLLALFVANLVLHGIQSTEGFQKVVKQVPGREMLWYWGEVLAHGRDQRLADFDDLQVSSQGPHPLAQRLGRRAAGVAGLVCRAAAVGAVSDRADLQDTAWSARSSL